MNIDKSSLLDVLMGKGVTELYHANSVLTSIQYIRNSGLLSRAYADDNGIPQTSQWTDSSDKKLRIWNDIFLDTVDIHRRASRANDYGPVLFVFDVNVLKLKAVESVWITKCNPYRWEGMEQKERWFSSLRDVNENLIIGEFGQSIVIRFCGRLPIKKYLRSIILDDPSVVTDRGACFYRRAYRAIKDELEGIELDIQIKKRQCVDACSCVRKYQAWNCVRATKMFDLVNAI